MNTPKINTKTSINNTDFTAYLSCSFFYKYFILRSSPQPKLE